MTKKLKKFLVCIISVFCVVALGVAIGCADSTPSEKEILTDAEERVFESDNLPINDPSCCEEDHMVQTLAASQVKESHSSHTTQITSSTTTISSGNYYLNSDVKLNSYINVTGSVHICLNGHTLTGGSNSVIVVNGGTLYLHDCQGSGKITGGVGSNIIWTTGGTSQSMGGGITVANGGTLHMYGGTITGNKAGAMGGGVIVAYNSNMIMYGGTISDNTGGWLGNGGVGVLGYFLMTGGTISGNSEPSSANGFGGGVSVSTEGSYAGTFEMTGGTISGNSSKQGAGVYAYTSTSLKITGGTISGNKASAEGGGVYSLVNTTISGATITGNTTTISSSSYGGGGISVPYGTATISNCTITDNSASNGCGGGICVNSGCTATLSGCTITGNSAGKYGNGIYFSGTLKISGKMVVHANPDKNSTQQDIYLSSGQYVTLGGNLSSGSDVGIYFASSSQTQVTTSESSTSYYKNSYSYFFPDSKSGYFATYSSYVYFTNSNGYFLTSFKLTSSVSTSRTYNDLSTAVGTASSAYDSAATVTVQKAVSVSSNVTIASGTSVTFDTAGYKITGPSSSYLFNVKGTLSIKGKGTITGCSSSYGAIYVPSGGSLSIQDVTISGNYSSGYGGGVYIASSSASFTMSSGYIQNNTAKTGGAGIYLASNATATFTGGTVYNNTVSGSANNIYLSSGATIKFSSKNNLTNTKVGVTAAGTGSSSVQITNAVNSSMTTADIDGHVIADSCKCVCVTSGVVYFADDHNYKITGFTYVDDASGCTATATNTCGYCDATTTTAGMAVTYGFDSDGNAYRYVEGYEEYKEEFSEGFLVESASGVYTLYDTLEEALENAADGSTIHLLEDIAGGGASEAISVSGNVTIDLNGHTVERDISAENGATVTITDGIGGGKVTGTLSEDTDGGFVLRGGTYSGNCMDFVLERTDWTDMVVAADGTSYTVTSAENVGESYGILVEYASEGEGRSVYFASTTEASSFVNGNELSADITLVGDVAGDLILTTTGDTTISLGGHTLTGNLFVSGGDTDISFGEGTLEGSLTVSADKSSVKLEGGTATGDISLGGQSSEINFGGGTAYGLTITSGEAFVDLDGGSVTGIVTLGGDGASLYFGVDGSVGGLEITNGYNDVHMEGGTVSGSISVSGEETEADIDFDGGTVTGGVSVTEGTVTIDLGDSGGTIAQGVSVSGGEAVLDLYGGTVSGGISVSGGGELTVVDTSYEGGGTVEGNVTREDGSTLTVRAGTYSSCSGVIPYVDWSAYVLVYDAEGATYTVTDNPGKDFLATLTYNLDDDSTVAIYCDTLTDAVSVAKLVEGNGQTVTLLGDAGTNAENISVTIGTDVTLDLNGYTVYGSITVTDGATVTIVDGGTEGPDKGYGDGAVTGYVGATNATLHVTAGTYYCDSVLNHLGDGTGESYVAAVDDVETEGETSPLRVYIVMTEQTAVEIAADVYVASSYYYCEAENTYYAGEDRTYYIRLDVALTDVSKTEKGGMIFVYKDSVSETEITLEGRGFVLVIDLNGNKIEVNLLIKADSSEYVEGTGDAASGRQAGDGASLIVTSSCSTTTPSVSGIITVDGESEDYEIWGPYDSVNVPYPTGITMTDAKISGTQTGTTVLTAGQELELSATVAMFKDWKAYDGEVTWSICGGSGVVSFVDTDPTSVGNDGTFSSTAEDSVSTVKIKAESPGTVKVLASVKGKTESGSCVTYTAEADIVVKTDFVTDVTITRSGDDTAEESIVLTLSDGANKEGNTASLEAVIKTAYGTKYSTEDIEWKSLNEAVATVTAGDDKTTATVEGVAAGVTIITVIVDGVESGYVTVIVKSTVSGDTGNDAQLGDIGDDDSVVLPDQDSEISLGGAVFANNDNLEIYKEQSKDNSYVITGTASQMTTTQATAFGGGAAEGDAYVIFGIKVASGESIYKGCDATGTSLWENSTGSDDYYGVIMRLVDYSGATYTVTHSSGGSTTYTVSFGEITKPSEVTVSSVTVIPDKTSLEPDKDGGVTFKVIITYSDNTILLLEDLKETDLTYCLEGVTWTVCCCDCEGTCGCACCGGDDECACECGCDGVCGCAVENTEGGYTFTPTAAGVYKISVSVKKGESTNIVTSNVVTITVATSETGKTYSISVAKGDESVTESALTSGENYTVSLTEDNGGCTGSVTWISSDSTVAAVGVGDNGSATLYAKMAGTATIYAVVNGVNVAYITVTISAPVTEDEEETKEFFNSYENTLLFVNGVTYSTDLKVVLNLTSVLEGDDMGYNFMLSAGDEGDATAVYSIVAGHIHHYRYDVWSMSDDGVISLRFVCGCNAGETDEDGNWVTYTVDTKDGTLCDSILKTTVEKDCDEGGKVKVTYEVSVYLPASMFKEEAIPDYAGDYPYSTTFTIYPTVMVEFYDSEEKVVATLYFEDAAVVSATVRDVLSENETYSSVTITLLSDVKADLEISTGDITVNINGFCLDGDVTVSNDAKVAIENVTDDESTTVLVHGDGGKVTGEVEADGSGEISITGGSYSHKEVADYVAAGYVIVYDENTGYTVKSQCDIVESDCEAKIDVGTNAYTIYYTTLEAALRDAEDGDTVTLLTDVGVTPEKTYIVGSDITLNLDGHALTGRIETSSGTEVEINLGGGSVTGGITAYGDLKLSLGVNETETTSGSVGSGVTVYGDAGISLGGGTIKGGVTLYGDSEVSFGGGEIEGGLTLSGGNAEIDLEGGTVMGDVSVTSGAETEIDLGGGKIYGDISVSGGSALSISDSSEAEDDLSYGNGLVIGDISTENSRSSVEISGGTYSYDVTDLVSDGLVVFVGSYTCPVDEEIRVYTVMSEKDAQSLSEASRTYENGAGDTVTVYYDGIGDALGDLLSGDILTIWATITPEGEDGLVISGADGSAVKNVTVDLNGNTVEGGLTVSGESSVVLDLNGGKVSGDITAEAGSSLYVTDTSEEEEGIVTGKVSGDAAAVEIDAGTYGSNVLGYITDGKVIYVNAVKECGEGNTYTVTTAEEISESGKHVGATVTYEKNGETVTVYFESSVDAVEYAKTVSTDGVTAYVTLYETIDYTETGLGGIETTEGNDIVINLNGHGITGDITVVSGSSLKIEDTDPQTYDGDVTRVELVDGEISVEVGGTLSVTGGIYTDDISGYLSEDDFALVSSYEKEDGESGKIYEIVGEDLAKDLSVVSISTDREKPVYYADADAAVSGAEEILSVNAEANLTIVVVADGVTGADFSLPSGDVTIDLNGNTLEGDITLGTDEGGTKVTLTFTDSEAGDDGMTGGGFTGTMTVIGENTDSEVILEAGTYDKDAFDDYEGGLTFAEIRDGEGNVVDRYVPVYGDETFTVIPESAACDHSVAGVDLGDGFTVYFTDIDDALKYAAENGGTVTLYTDAESSAEISVTADVTIDLNGHSLVAADVVIYADDGGTLTITDESEGGRFRGHVTAEVSDEGYSEDKNPYEDAIVLEIKPMEGDLVVTVVTDAENAEETVSEYYVFSETAGGFGIVNIADHTHRCDVPVWEYMASGEFEGMIKLTFKCACGKFDDFVGYYQITATENEDGTVTFTAEAEIFSEAHKGTYTYDETKKVAAKVNVDGRTIYYEDIKEALEAAEESGATLVLMDDFSGELSVSSDVTINLNGHDVSGEISVDGGAALEIEGEGRVDASIELDSGADIVVGGGTYNEYNFDEVSGHLADGCAVVIGKDSNGNTVYTVCDVTAAEENSEAAIYDEDGNTTYYESIEDAVNGLKEGDTLILWDDVESGLTIDADKTGHIEIDLNGEEILGGINIESSDETEGVTVTVTDSTSEGGKGDGKVVGGITAGENVTLVIEGGTYGAGAGSAGAEGEDGSEGGNAYDEDIIRDSAAEDKVIFNNADGSISVMDEDVAEAFAGAAVTWIDGGDEHTEYYETLQDAVEDATGLEGAVVTLYGDNPSDITVSGDVTIDLNGHTEDGDVTVSAGATLILTDSSDDNSGTVDGKIITQDPSSGEEKTSGKVILSGGTYDFDSFDDGALENVSLGGYTDENGDGKSYVAVYGDLETSVDGDGNETVSGTFTVMTEGEAQNSGAVKVTIATAGGDDATDVYFKDIESALEYVAVAEGKVTLTLYGDTETEDVIEITGEVEIDLNGHTLDADIMIDAVTNPGASLTVTGGGEISGTITVILDDSSTDNPYEDTLKVDGSIDISDLDVGLKNGSADGEPAENFVFEGIDSDDDDENDYYGIAGGDGHEHAYELVSVVYDEKNCTVTIVIKCACGYVFMTKENVAVEFGDYDKDNGTVTGTVEIQADTDDDDDYEIGKEFEITLTPVAEVVTEGGDTYYFESLDDAVAFVAEKDVEGVSAEIILLTDVENITVTGDENVVIDLDGHTVTGTVSVDEDASLTINGTGKIDAQIDVRGDLTIEGGNYCESEETYEGQITIRPDDSIDVAEGGTLTIEGVVEIILDGTDLDIGSTYVEAEDGDAAQFEFSYGVVIGGDLTITVTGDSTLSAEGELTITDGGNLTINIEGGTLTLDTDGNSVTADVTVGGGANLVAEDTSGTNEGRLDGKVTVEEGGYVAFEDETFADEGDGLEIVFEGNTEAEKDKYIMESAADEYGETYQRSTTREEHLSHGHAFDSLGAYVYNEETEEYDFVEYVFDPSMSVITMYFTCLCGETLTYSVYLTEDDYYAFVTEIGEGDEKEEIVEIVYSLTAVVVSTNGTSAEYGLYGTAYIPMFQRADDATRSDPETYVYSEDNPYYYGAEDASCTEGGEDVYIYGTQNGVIIRESVGIIHHGLEEVGVAENGRKIYHCTWCGGYFMEGYTDIAGDAAYGDLSEIEKELEREEIFNETKDELLSELESRLTGCTGDYGAAKEAYDKAVSEIDDWEYEFGGGEAEDRDDYLESLLAEIERAAAEAEFVIAEETQKTISENELKDLFKDILDEDGNVTEKYEEYYSEPARQQIRELYDTALQDLGNFGFSADDVEVTDSDSRYLEYTEWLEEMYGTFVQRIADELKSIDVIKVDTHEELSDEDTMFSYVSNEAGMSGAIKLIITKVDGSKLDKAIGKATVVSGDADGSEMTEEEMQAALEGKSVIGVYDFKLWDTLSDVQVITFNGYYYVCLQLPEELQGRDDLQIVYLGDDGVLEVYRTYTDLDAGCLYFTTTHFSRYIIMGVEEKDLMPPIIVLSVFGGMELIALVILIAVFVVRKKKENVVEESAPAKKKLAGLGILPLLAVIIPTGAVGIIIGLAVANALFIAGIIVFIYLILTKTGKGVVEYEMDSSDGNAPSGAGTSLQDGLASNCSAIDEAKGNNS